jgi:hypothetical protein
MTTTRTQRADALERWADDVDTALLDAICDARNADRSWSEIGAMLGVSKHAAQRKYAAKISA